MIFLLLLCAGERESLDAKKNKISNEFKNFTSCIRKKGPTGRLNTKFHNPRCIIKDFRTIGRKWEGALTEEIINLFPENEKGT